MARLLRVAFLSILFVGFHAAGQDYEREQRWAEEVVPTLVVGEAVWLTLADGPGKGRRFLSIWTEVPNARGAVALVHGIGLHPDHGIVGELRVLLSDAGWSTLSVQMPVLGREAGPFDYYPAVFPEAGNRIASAGRFLQGKGFMRPVLLSHGMGSWMSNVYLAGDDSNPFGAWVELGIGGRFWGMFSIGVPTLDLYGEHDIAPGLRSAWLRRMQLLFVPRSRQVMIPGADYSYTGHEKEAAAEILRFLDEVATGARP